MAKRLIIADLKSNNNHGLCTGHFWALAKNYQEVFSPYCEVKIASGPIYLKGFSAGEMMQLPCDYIAGEPKVKNVIRMVRNGWSLFRQTRENDVIVIQQSQPAMILFTLLLTCFRKNGVFQIQYSNEPMNRRYYRFMMNLKKKCIRGTLCPNKEVGKAYGVPYLVIPDYIYASKEPGISTSYEDKTYDFCSIGRIAKDKGVAETVHAIAGKNVSFLVAGQAQIKEEEDSIRQDLSQCSNIIAKLEYLSEENYKKYIQESRYCILNYQKEYSERSSGVVLDTLFNGVPVIGKRCKALQFIEDMNLGILYDNINTFDFQSALDPVKYEGFIQGIQKYRKSFQTHIVEMRTFLQL